MATAYLGEIRIFAGNFAPVNWALCQGQLLAIQSNTALFSLLGVNYGGDGRTTFGLPDLRGRLEVGVGFGPGLSQYFQGETSGVELVTLTTSTLGAHTHTIAATTSGDQLTPSGTVFGEFPSLHGKGTFAYAPVAAATPVAMNSQALGASGGSSQAHSNMQPYLALNFIIALTGVFPPRP